MNKNNEEIEVVEAEIVEVMEDENFVIKQKKYTQLKVFIDIEKENIHFDFALPLSVISMLGGFTTIIPENDIKKIGKEGFDFKNYDFKKLLNDIETGQLRNPIIYKLDMQDNGNFKIKIYVD
ncbi:MAG: hypothetical protein ACRCTZ_02695 [Sarcina sp.]